MIECLRARVVVLEDIIHSVGAEHLLNMMFDSPICILEEIKASYFQDQTSPQLLKCIAPCCNKKYQSAENLLRHIRSTQNHSHQFYHMIFTRTYCFQCGMEFSTNTFSLAKYEKDHHGESSIFSFETL